MILRPVLGCLATLLLTACAFAPPPAANLAPREYRGVVLDANTGAPVPRAIVTAEYHYFGTTYLLPEEYLGFTLTREDGSFDLTIPASKKPANHLEAGADVLPVNAAHPRRGQNATAHGVLNHVSARRTNTILLR